MDLDLDLDSISDDDDFDIDGQLQAVEGLLGSPRSDFSEGDLGSPPSSPLPDSQYNEPLESPPGSPTINPAHSPQLSGFQMPTIRTATSNRHQAIQSHPPGSDATTTASMSVPFSSEFTEDDNETVIWGTTISVELVIRNFKGFLTNFKEHELDFSPHYMNLLYQILETEEYVINVDLQHVKDYDENLYIQTILYPQEMLNLYDIVINDVFRELANVPAHEMLLRVQPRPFNVSRINSSIQSKFETVRDLQPNDLNTLVSVRGMVTRSSPIIPDMRLSFFQCHICCHSVIIPIDRGNVNEPSNCPECQAKWSMKIIHNRCRYEDKQAIKLQETPDSIPEGETPHTVHLCGYGSLVDSIKPGDRVNVTGIYRAQPMQTSRATRNLKSIYKTYIDVVHVQLIDRESMPVAEAQANASKGNEQENTSPNASPDFDEFSKLSNDNFLNPMKGMEKIQKFHDLAKRADLYDVLTRSLAPSIWQLDDVKKGILCLLFGGVEKKFSQSGEGRFRSEINVLLVGDPGTSKSQLLQYVHKIAPRGIYTSGKGSSAVGLTASVTKDPDTGQSVLESGALVLSDRGVCCIDEFDKMSDQTRSILHEAMEQQTVSIAKAGIICTLNARTSILASANPRESRYNPRMSVVDNIDLTPTLLSRFDLIYLVLDKPDPETDKRLAHHLVSLYWKTRPSTVDFIDKATLRDYIAYARKNFQPVITDEAMELLVDGYVKMRRIGTKKTISATPRQLESLIRISEALAKMHLSNVVTADHVNEALRLMRVALQQAAVDPRTGTIDMDLIQTGRSASSRQRMAGLLDAVRELLQSKAVIVTDRLFAEISKQREEVKEALMQLEQEGFVTLSGDIRNQTVRRV